MTGVRFPPGDDKGIYSLRHRVQTVPGKHSASHLMGIYPRS